MIPQDKYSQGTHSYLTLRKAVGWIGLLLPFVLMFGVFVIFKDNMVQKSISYYYHTGMGDVFVGSICAIALFLFFYTGYDKWDNWAGNVAGFFAVALAWFPTTEFGPTDVIGIIHLACATGFFITLAVFSLFLFTKQAPNPTPQKVTRNNIYIACGLIMIVCLISIAIYLFVFDSEGSNLCFVFCAETVALIAFGVSWLTKGGTLCADK